MNVGFSHISLEIATVFWVEGGNLLFQGELAEGPAVASPSACARWEMAHLARQ